MFFLLTGKMKQKYTIVYSDKTCSFYSRFTSVFHEREAIDLTLKTANVKTSREGSQLVLVVVCRQHFARVCALFVPRDFLMYNYQD